VRTVDELLRIRALEMLGPLGDPLARSALESGVVAVEHDVRAWEGSHGTVHAHRVVMVLAEDLHARFVGKEPSSHAARDALSAALSAAMAERAGNAVDDVALEAGAVDRPSSPYRDRG
jgi:hypothetical protein